MIEFRALGTLVLRGPNGEDIDSVLAQPKRVALLAYLAIARPRGFHRRDALLALLWPEQDEQHARWALNQALRQLRISVGKEAVSSRGDGEVGVEPQLLSCDAVDFEAAIDRDDPARALALYRGDLLDGFHVSGCGEFERWLEAERVWLRRRAARAASTLALHEEARGESVAAGHWARRAFALSSDDEAEARCLIELLDRVGDRAGAVRAYEEFARRLRDEYEVEPAPETRALMATVLSRQLAVGALPASAPRVRLSQEVEVASAAPVSAVKPQAPRRSRRAMPLALSSLLFLGLVAVVWGFWPARPAPAAPSGSLNTIAVFPFGYRGNPGLAYLGDGMVDLLSANLNGAGEIRTVDPHTVLALVRQAGDAASEPDQAGKLATRLRAGSFVLGDVVEAGGHLRISARLYAVPHRGEPPASPAVEGAPRQLFQLVDGLTSQLIARRSSGPAANFNRLAALTTDSLSALKAYLEGERQFRIGKPDSGIQSLERAIQIDSSFALAHYRMASAIMWSSDLRPRSSEAADRALRFGHRLSDRDRRIMRALAASLHGRIAEAEQTYRDLVSRYPDDLEANYQLGDLIFHRRAMLRRSWLDARPWFERVLAIDPRFQGALYHLGNIASRERKLQELDDLTRRALEIAPEPDWGFRGQRAVVFGDTAGVRRFTAAMRGYGDNVAQPTIGFLVFTTGDLATGRRLWRTLVEPARSRGVRVLAHITLAKMEVMSGRWRAAKAELDAAAGLDPATSLEHRALLSLWPLLKPSRSELMALRDSVFQWKAVAGSPNETGITGEHTHAHPYLRLYLLGLLSVRLGQKAAALDYAAQLHRRSESSFAPTFVDGLGQTLRAVVARADGHPEEALRTLDSVAFWTQEDLELTGSSPFYAHEYEQFLRAELLDTLGRREEALESYRAIADELFHSGAPAQLRMAEIYDQHGEREKAKEHYGRFIELWKDCDAELRPLVKEARERTMELSSRP